MIVSLYTSRVILKVLGIQDFGIYNVVGGIVLMFSFLNNAMTSTTQRFLNYELGINNIQDVKKIFSMSMTVHIVIAILVIIFSETLGLWFLNAKVNIPEERLLIANIVYQFSIVTFIIQVVRVPYNASIIAYEKMSFYAYISIIESVLKLAIVFILVYFGLDKLLMYSILTCIVTLIMLLAYKVYCIKIFDTCRYHFYWDISLFKNLISFSSWSLFGSIANVGAQQGLNLLLNIFWGVIVNASMGIANQLSSIAYGFVSNFQTAFNPQIIKSYASDDKAYFTSLIFKASKFSYFLMLLLALPILMNIDFILKLWLHIVPEYSANFCSLIIIFLLVDAISAPLWMAVQATGNIKSYQIIIAIIILLNLPISYVLLEYKVQPYFVLYIRIILNVFALFFRLFYLEYHLGIRIQQFFNEVGLVILFVTMLSFPLPLLIKNLTSNFSGVIITTVVTIISTAVCIYTIGLNGNEQKYLRNIIWNFNLAKSLS